MNLRGLTLRDLTYVVAVADHGHFGHAAEACAVSQPSLSVGVRKIEEALGYPLFERTPRNVLVTRQGAAAVARAREVLRSAECFLALTGQEGAPLAGPFSLGAIATVGPYLLPPILGPLRNSHPDLRLSIEEGVTERLVERLHDGALDAVLLSPPIAEASLILEPLYREPFRLIVPANSDMARRERISVDDLDPSEAVLLEEGHCLRDQTLDICGASGARTRHAAMSLETLKAMVAAGAGYSLIPATAIRHPEPLGELVGYRTLAEMSVGRTVALAWRRSRPDAAAMKVLADLIRATLPTGAEPIIR